MNFICKIGTDLQYLNIAYNALIGAYNDLKNVKFDTSKCNENKIRDELVKLAKKKPSPLFFRWSTEFPDLDKNNRIDIELINPLSLIDNEKGIKIECKIIKGGSEYIDTKETHEREINPTNGIMSFISGKYASKMPIAGMIGFIKEGKIDDKIKKVESKIKDHKQIKTIKNLTFYKIDDKFVHSYHSQHERYSGLSEIDIYHLFFNFC